MARRASAEGQANATVETVDAVFRANLDARSLAQVIVSPLSRGVLLKQPSLYKGMRSLILISYFCTKHRTFARKLSFTPSAWLAQTPANGAIIITTSQERRWVDRFERPPRAEFAVGDPNDDDEGAHNWFYRFRSNLQT